MIVPLDYNSVLWWLAGSVATNIGGFVIWGYKKVRNSQIESSFVTEMATKHLPYIYIALTELCEKAGVKIEAHPNIGFVKLNGDVFRVEKIHTNS